MQFFPLHMTLRIPNAELIEFTLSLQTKTHWPATSLFLCIHYFVIFIIFYKKYILRQLTYNIYEKIKYGTFDFHWQTLKPYQEKKKKLLSYVSEKQWTILLKFNKILCKRNDIKLCISAENGYKYREIILSKSKNK